MRRLLSVVAATMTLAGLTVIAPQAAQAATTCSRSWHYITHGETGLNVRPDPLLYQGNTTLYADATPGTDTWNQAFLFCRDPAWTADHYAVYSNLTGGYWSGNNYILYAGSESITGQQELFSIWRYDSTWWVIRYVGFPFYPAYVSPNRTPGWSNTLTYGQGPLNGSHLFRITPSNLMG